MPTDRQQYAKALNDVALRYGRMERDTLRRIWKLLRQVEDEIRADLVGAEGFRAYRLREVLRSIERYLDRFDAEAAAALGRGLRQSCQFGGAYVVEPLRAIGIAGAFNQVTPATLNAVVDLSADLVTGITADVRRFINIQVRQAALQQITPLDAMKAISQHMGFVSMRPGRETVKGVAYNAERIVRTEMSRTFNLAAHSQQLATAKRVPELQKRWVASGDGRTRESHLVAHMRYLDNPIPVSEPFIVQGESLMYPGDPSGSPGNVINCRCKDLTIHPRVGVLGTSLDGRIAAELKRRREALAGALCLLRERPTTSTQLAARVVEDRMVEVEAAILIAA